MPAPAGEVWDLVAALPERQRQVVVLRHVADLKEAQYASVLNISRSTVSTTFRDAHQRLGSLLDDGVEITTPATCNLDTKEKTDAELAQLVRPLIDQPLVERPDVSALRGRNRRRHSRRLTGLSVFLVVALGGAFGLTQLGNKVPATRPAHLASYFEVSINVPDSTLAAVGLPASVSVPTKLTPTIATATTNQVVSYVGADCP